MCCAKRLLLPTSHNLSTVSFPYPQFRIRFQSSLLSTSEGKLCGAGRDSLTIQSSSHFRVDLSVVRPRYAVKRPCKHVRRQAAVHACRTVSLNDPKSSSGKGNSCTMWIYFVGSRCTAFIHASVLLRSSGNSARAEVGQETPCFSQSSGHVSRVARSSACKKGGPMSSMAVASPDGSCCNLVRMICRICSPSAGAVVCSLLTYCRVTKSSC